MSSRQPLDVSGDALAVVKASWRLIARLVRDQPVAYAIAATGAVVFTSAIVASALVIGKVTDDLIVPVLERGEPLDGGLRLAVVLIVGVAVVKAVGIVVRRTAAYWLQGVAQARLRKRLIGHQLELSLRWYGSRATGDLLSVVDNDARQTTFVLAPLPFATGVVFLLVGSVVVITLTDVWLGLAGLVLLAAVVALDIRGSWLTFEAMAEAQVRRGRVGDTAHESFDGALTVKALGREQVEADRFRAVVYRLRDQLIDVGRVWTLYRAVTEALPAIGTVLILYLGVVRIATGALTTGELVRVAYLLSLLAVPVRLIGYLLWDAAHSVAGWQRVEEVLTAGDRVAYGDEPPRRRGAGPAPVRVDGVGFGYDDGSPVLEDVELDVPAGRTLAVVGPTASGKSTLARLLVRLWDPVDGAIRLDGRDLRSLRPGGVAREVAFVAQDTFLFDDTVAGNIALGRDVPREVVEVAARRAAAEQFIARLPDGYDTRVGERGTTLSGGQQQRVALARALAGRPRLLVLDDATSAVDPSVEVRILERLKAAQSPATVVVVAYRRSTIALADEVAYVEGGRIRAYGTHEELLATEPGYAELLQAYEFEGDERRAATGPAAGPSRGGGRR